MSKLKKNGITFALKGIFAAVLVTLSMIWMAPYNVSLLDQVVITSLIALCVGYSSLFELD